jgi:hypothetical protein
MLRAIRPDRRALCHRGASQLDSCFNGQAVAGIFVLGMWHWVSPNPQSAHTGSAEAGQSCLPATGHLTTRGHHGHLDLGRENR